MELLYSIHVCKDVISFAVVYEAVQ